MATRKIWAMRVQLSVIFMGIQATVLVMVVMVLIGRPCPQQLQQTSRDSPLLHLLPQPLFGTEDSPLLQQLRQPIFGTGESVKLAVPINCSKLVAGDEGEIQRVKQMATWENVTSDGLMLEKFQNCSWLDHFLKNDLYNSELEKSFPLAFTFVVHDSPQQVLRLLRLLYRPQNSYCIHYDAKSTDEFKEFFNSIANCRGNVIIASRQESVVWGHYSVLGAQMNCMKDLLNLRTQQEYKWKYLLSLCGKELPLITNREMVSRLVSLNGSSSVWTYKSNSRLVMSRIKYSTKLNKEKTQLVKNTSDLLSDPPFNISQYYKSQSYVALSHPFAEFLHTNATAIKIHEFFKNCGNPEEHFYATIFMLPGVPGGYDRKIKYFVMESAFWIYHNETCHGKVVHRICIVGVGDLPRVVQMAGGHFFHNKYFMEYDHTVMSCMEERIVQMNKLEYQQELAILKN